MGVRCSALGLEFQCRIYTADWILFTGSMNKLFGEYDRLEELPEPGLPTKYPSLPGYRPRQEDNTYNAW